MPPSPEPSFWKRTLLFGGVLLALLALFFWSRPQLIAARADVPGMETERAFTRLHIHAPDAQSGTYVATLALDMNALHPSHFYLRADDCIEELTVNGRAVTNIRYPLCRFPWGATVNLKPYLQPGTNVFRAVVFNRYDGETSLSVRTWFLDPLTAGLVALMVLSLLWYLHAGSIVRPTLRRLAGWCRHRWSGLSREQLAAAARTVCWAAVAFVLAVYLPLMSFRPVQEQFTYQVAGEPLRTVPPPLELFDGTMPTKEYYVVETVWHVSNLYHTRYRIAVNECIDELWINNRKVEEGFPLCNYPYSTVVDLSDELRPGKNHLKIQVLNYEADTYLSIRPSFTDPLFWPYYLLLLAGIAWLIRRRGLPRLTMARAEYSLLALFLGGRLWSFVRHIYVTDGWDWFPHLLMIRMDLVTWTNIMPMNVTEHFYSYHPPLGFLLARILTGLDIGQVTSLKLVSFGASLAAFFVLRRLLKHMQLLHRPAPMAFLYIGNSIPVLVFLSRSINLDILIYAFTVVTLACSAALFFRNNRLASPVRRNLAAAGVVLGIAGALMTKFSGLLLTSIPVFTAVTYNFRGLLARSSRAWRAVGTACLLSAVAVVLVFPYYHIRYRTTTGTYFPHNAQFFQADYDHGQKLKEEMGAKYILEILKPSELSAIEPHWRDTEFNRLPDAWKGMWIRDALIGSPNPISMWFHGVLVGAPSPLSMKISVVYLSVMRWLTLLGFVLFCITLLRGRLDRKWAALGSTLLLFTAVQVAALFVYMWKHACSTCYTSKATYIVSASLTLAFLLVQILHWQPLRGNRRAVGYAEYALLLLAFWMVIAHHLVPVY